MRFELGQVFATAAVCATMDEDKRFGDFVWDCFSRYDYRMGQERNDYFVPRRILM